jgi:hypothetical protein
MELPIHNAVQSGCENMQKRLITTIFLMMFQKGRKDLVSWLLSIRPEAANSSTIDGQRLLHQAVATNNIEMCQVDPRDTNCFPR